MGTSLRLVFAVLLACAGVRMLLISPGGGTGCMWKGCLFIFGALILAVSLVLRRFLTRFERRKVNERRNPTVGQDARLAAGRKFMSDAFRMLDEMAAKGKDVPPTERGTPEHPRPQKSDFDNGKCPYKRDASKPLGSKENPVVVGVPESSTHLVFSTDKGCWILTDGLGNGWIR